MNEKEYEAVAHSCDRLLRAPEATLEWVAVPWLHVIFPHPVLTYLYRSLIGRLRQEKVEVGVPRSRWMTTIRAVREAAAYLRVVARSVVHAESAPAPKSLAAAAAAGGPRDVVIVSWLLSPGHLSAERDFYFGDLQRLLAARGLSSILLLRNHTRWPARALAPLARRDGLCARMLLPDLLGPGDEVRLWLRIVRARASLRRVANALRDRIDRLVADEAHTRMAPGIVAPGLRLHMQLVEIARLLRPRVCMTLFEGHAWERCVFHASGIAAPGAVRVGYQHSTLYDRSHAMRRSLGDAFDPDLIFTLGDVTRDELLASGGMAGTRVVTLGSYRRPSDDSLPDAPRQPDAILVLPDGNLPQTVHLFEFALQCARILPQITFVLRTHPVLPFDRVRSHLRGLDEASNVVVSRGASLEEDLRRAGCLLYQGSSTAITAVLAGLKPFYLLRRDEIAFDPLERIPSWRERVWSVDGFRDAFEAYASQSPSRRQADWLPARDYCDRYMQPIRIDSIDELVRLAEMGKSR